MKAPRTGACCAPRLVFRVNAPGALLSVDSGAKKIGLAVSRWDKSPQQGRLVMATTLTAATDDAMIRLYLETLADLRRKMGVDLYTAVERPHKYVDKRSKHADLDRLLRFITQTGPWDGQFEPHEWKGSIQKAPHHARVLQVLRDEERHLATNAGPDTLDALAINLYVAGRTGTGGKTCPT